VPSIKLGAARSPVDSAGWETIGELLMIEPGKTVELIGTEKDEYPLSIAGWNGS
jgi:hypothetical protein